MNMDELVADASLDALEREMCLRRPVTEPAYLYYFGGGIVRVIIKIFLITIGFFWMFNNYDISGLEFLILTLAMIGVFETARQRERLNALVELMKIEKGKTEANKASEVTARKLAEG